METWTSKKLKDITTKIGSGATPRGGKGAYHQKGMPLIRSLNIYDLNFNYDDLAFIDESQAEQLDNVTVEKDDVLLNITGASVCRCTSVPEELAPARVNQHVSIIRADKKNLFGKYLKYVLVSPTYKRELWGLARTGATREALTKVDIENFKIKLPDIKTQTRIASVLSAYDDLIENNEKRIKALEEMAQLLYTEWFIKFKYPGHEKVKMVDSGTEYGMVPEGWEVTKIDSLLKNVKRKIKLQTSEYQKTGLYPIVDQGKDFIAGYTDNEDIIYKDDLIVFGDHSRCFKYCNFIFACGADGTQLLLTNDSNRMPEILLYHVILNSGLQNFNYARHFKFLKAIRVIKPDSAIAQKFSMVADATYIQIRALRDKNIILCKIRDLLIPQLVTGKRLLN